MDKKEKKQRPRHYLRSFFIGMVIIIIAAGFFIWRYFQKPSSGTIKTVSVAENVPVKEALERFEGEYFSFAHSSLYALKSHEKDFESSGVLLETAFFAQSDVNSKKIAITVENIQGRTMADTGNFMMRVSKPKNYKEEKFEVGGIKGISFSTTTESGFLEKVFFIPNGEYVAEFAFTAPTTGDEAPDLEMVEVLESIQWKK